MTNPVALLRTINDHGQIYKVIVVWCPGCEITDSDGHCHGGLHMLPLSGKKKWGWNRDLVHVTLDPSILTTMNRNEDEFRCHSFLQQGVWRFLSDCTHDLKDKVVPMVPLPDWVVRE